MPAISRSDSPGRVIVTVTGRNRPGIVASFSKVLAREEIDIVDLSQKLLEGDLFVMMLVASMDAARVPLVELRRLLQEEGERQGLQVSVHHEQLFRFINRV